MENISQYPIVTLRDILDYEKSIGTDDIQPIQKWSYEYPGVQGVAMQINKLNKEVIQLGERTAIFKFLNKEDERIIFPAKKTKGWILIPDKKMAEELEKEGFLEKPTDNFLKWNNGGRSYINKRNSDGPEYYPICTS